MARSSHRGCLLLAVIAIGCQLKASRLAYIHTTPRPSQRAEQVWPLAPSKRPTISQRTAHHASGKTKAAKTSGHVPSVELAVTAALRQLQALCLAVLLMIVPAPAYAYNSCGKAQEGAAVGGAAVGATTGFVYAAAVSFTPAGWLVLGCATVAGAGFGVLTGTASGCDKNDDLSAYFSGAAEGAGKTMVLEGLILGIVNAAGNVASSR